VGDEEIMDELRQSPEPAFTTGELAERFNMSTQGMRNRLEALAEEGRLYRKKPSARTVIWWVDTDHGAASFPSPSSD
jgi:predicted ArsR family transcriptional regulator